MNNQPLANSRLVQTTSSPIDDTQAGGMDRDTQLNDRLAAYRRFVPDEILSMIGIERIEQAELGHQIERKLTVLFADIRDFTTLTETMVPAKSFAFINAYLSALEPAVRDHRGVVDKFIGDGIMAYFGLNADSGVQAAIAMQAAVAEFNATQSDDQFPPIRIGVGLNTGYIALGTVGSPERMENTVIGDSVNLAARLESLNKTYSTGILIGEDTYYNLQQPEAFQIRFIDRVRVKGKLRAQSVYEVFDHDDAETRQLKSHHQETFARAIAYYHLRNVDEAEALFNQYLAKLPDDPVAQLYLQRCRRYHAGGIHEGTGELDQEVPWRDSYDLDIPQIDGEHRELLKCINRLLREIHHGDADRLEATLGFLGDYTAHHFQHEEKLMRACAYPFLEEHQHEHRRFIDFYRGLTQEILAKPSDRLFLLFKINLFLVDWFISHTTRTDKHFGNYLHHQIKPGELREWLEQASTGSSTPPRR